MSVKRFEEVIAEYYNAKYAVAVDCCTHAIELCLRYTNARTVTCPTRTYVSVPMTFEKLSLDWSWDQNAWQDYYYIGGSNIIDAAVYWEPQGYIHGTLMCLSFQYKKHLNLGRGGMILTDDQLAYQLLQKMKYDGRDPDTPWMSQNINMIGYHYYMTPETAILGLEKLPTAIASVPKKWGFDDYPFLPNMDVFNER